MLVVSVRYWVLLDWISYTWMAFIPLVFFVCLFLFVCFFLFVSHWCGTSCFLGNGIKKYLIGKYTLLSACKPISTFKNPFWRNKVSSWRQLFSYCIVFTLKLMYYFEQLDNEFQFLSVFSFVRALAEPRQRISLVWNSSVCCLYLHTGFIWLYK